MNGYGRRIMDARSGDIRWCGLTAEEVEDALAENVRLNGLVYAKCLGQAFLLLSGKKPEDRVASGAHPVLRQEALSLAHVLFTHCAVKSFVALKEALEEKVHAAKENGHEREGAALPRPGPARAEAVA